MRAVVAQADHRLGDRVARGEPAQLGERPPARCGPQAAAPAAPRSADRLRDGGVDQRVEGVVAERARASTRSSSGEGPT